MASLAGVAPRASGPSRSHSRGRTVLHLAVLTSGPPSRRIVGASSRLERGHGVGGDRRPDRVTAVFETGAAVPATSRALFAVALSDTGVARFSWRRGGCAGIRARRPSYPCGACRRHAARGVSWSHGDLLGAHLALTLAGWLGLAIIGPLHTFFRSLTQHSFAIPASSRPPISSGSWAPSSSLSALTSLRGLCWRVPALVHHVGRVLADRDKRREPVARLWRGDPEWQRLRPALLDRPVRKGAASNPSWRRLWRDRGLPRRSRTPLGALCSGQPSVHGPERPSGATLPSGITPSNITSPPGTNSRTWIEDRYTTPIVMTVRLAGGRRGGLQARGDAAARRHTV